MRTLSEYGSFPSPRNEPPRSKLPGIKNNATSGFDVVGWVETHCAETHRSGRWVSLTLNPSYAGFKAQQAAGNEP